jgi:hypothetical protein
MAPVVHDSPPDARAALGMLGWRRRRKKDRLNEFPAAAGSRNSR